MSSNPVLAKLAPQIENFPYQEASGATEVTPFPGVSFAALKEQQQREQAAREAGQREGEAKAKAWFEVQVRELRSELAKSIEQFSQARHEYFLAAERELVQLACSIARKILRRESNIDPQLLAGMARVALEALEQKTKVTLRASPEEVPELRLFFARALPERPPEILEDSALRRGQCIIQTEFGITEIGPEVQLKEIELGLFDLQAARSRADS